VAVVFEKRDFELVMLVVQVPFLLWENRGTKCWWYENQFGTSRSIYLDLILPKKKNPGL